MIKQKVVLKQVAFIKLAVYTITMLSLFALSACSTNNYNTYKAGMTETDLKMQESGHNLYCTELINNVCLTHQWLLEKPTGYTLFEADETEPIQTEPVSIPDVVEPIPTCVATWCDLPIQACGLPPLTGGTDSCGNPCSKPSVEWTNCIE